MQKPRPSPSGLPQRQKCGGRDAETRGEVSLVRHEGKMEGTMAGKAGEVCPWLYCEEG